MGWPVIVSKSEKLIQNQACVTRFLWTVQGRLIALFSGWVDLSLSPLFTHLSKWSMLSRLRCCRCLSFIDVFGFFPLARLCSPVADRNCAVFLFFRAIMEHKELLKVQWDWQIGKPLILTVFTLGLIAWAQTWVEFNHLLPAQSLSLTLKTALLPSCQMKYLKIFETRSFH